MKINHIASGSSGNAILVDDGYSQLLLDAGITYKKLSRKVKLTDISGVLITHAHLDHCCAVPELLRRGYKVFMSQGTRDALHGSLITGLMSPWTARAGSQREVGSWIVLPFDVLHDTPEPLGFLIQSTVTGEKLVYIVDSGLVQYNFSGVTHWLLECNYSEPLLEDGPYEEPLKDRVRKNHLSLEDLKTSLGDSDLSATEEIHLLHLSSANADEEQFKTEIQRLTGVPVFTISDSDQKRLYPDTIPSAGFS